MAAPRGARTRPGSLLLAFLALAPRPAAASLERALARTETTAPPMIAVARLPAADPAWSASFDRLGVPFSSPSAAAPLAYALSRAGLDPARLEALDREARGLAFAKARAALLDTAEAAALPALTAAARLPLERAGAEELASARAELDYLTESLSPYLAPETAARARRLRRAVRSALERRQRQDQRARIEAGAAALGGLREEDAIRLPAGALERAASARLRRPREARLAAFAERAAALFAGKPPVLAAGLDGALADPRRPLSPESAAALARYLTAGGRLAVVAGESIESLQKRLLVPLRRALGPETEALSRLALLARDGAQTYRWDFDAGRPTLRRIVDLEGALVGYGAPGGAGRVRDLIAEASRRFDFELAMRLATGRGTQGPMVQEDRVRGALTQIVFHPAGAAVEERAAALYDEAGGAARREAYAAFLNHRLREEGLPLEARLQGRTAIVIGVDKSFGLRAAAEEFRTEPGRMAWAGSSHGLDGGDARAARLAGLVIGVGEEPGEAPGAFHEKGAGPEGLLPYLEKLPL